MNLDELFEQLEEFQDLFLSDFFPSLNDGSFEYKGEKPSNSLRDSILSEKNYDKKPNKHFSNNLISFRLLPDGVLSKIY
jgi:hypothetical protein